MTIASQQPIAEVTAAGIAALRGAAPQPERLVALPSWSRQEAAAAAAALANTTGGLVIIGASAGAAGAVTAFTGTDVPEAELAAVARDLGPAGPFLVETAAFDIDGKRVAVLRVGECADTPVVVETDGGVYRRAGGETLRLTTRQALDELYAKSRRLRERAETNLEALLARIAFGHFNYMTIAVAAAPRFPGSAAYEWAQQDPAAVVDPALGFARRWGLDASSLEVTPGELSFILPADDTGFVRIVRNGCVAVGLRMRRPAQDRYLSPADFSALLAEMAELLSRPFQANRYGLVLGAAFLEGVRDLRLPVEGGLTAPVRRDLVQEHLPERYLHDASERAAFTQDLQAAVGAVFNADLVNGTGEPYAGHVAPLSVEPKTWHGTTKRTERRLAGARGHGSV
ncbi:MAG: hypothetical protein Kow0010_04910 [Dehalococcoidia bacterium]